MSEEKVILDSTYRKTGNNTRVYQQFAKSGVLIFDEKRKASDAKKPIMGRLGLTSVLLKK